MLTTTSLRHQILDLFNMKSPYQRLFATLKTHKQHARFCQVRPNQQQMNAES